MDLKLAKIISKLDKLATIENNVQNIKTEFKENWTTTRADCTILKTVVNNQ